MPKLSERNFLERVCYAIRFGLVLQRLRFLLGKLGIVIVPYYWIEEGGEQADLARLEAAQEYTFRLLDDSDLQSLAALEPGLSPEELLSRRRPGKLCYGALYRGEVAALNWIDLERCDFIARPYVLAANEAYLSTMYTRLAFRGRNLAPHLRRRSYEMLEGMGRSKFFSVSDVLSPAAIGFKKKLGARFVFFALYIRLFGRIERHWIVKRYAD